MITLSRFKPAWWLPGPHLQTIWPPLFRRLPDIALYRERLELPDGDFIDLDWTVPATRSGPIAFILHGLEGSSQSHYAVGILIALQKAGLQGLVINFRGCSGESNRFLKSYHAGETQDIQYTVEQLLRRYPSRELIGIGYSLGGNALLKWLSETGAENALVAAVAVSVPFDLLQAAFRLERGVSRIYQHYLLDKLKQSAQRKQSRPGFPLDSIQLRRLNSLREFDNLLTAPLHGFDGVYDYYKRCSSRRSLKNIVVPTLILHARDDPFMSETVIPSHEELAESITLEISNRGGHVGFVASSAAIRPRYWLEERIVQWLTKLLGSNTG